jgi:small redox-active disulfide protein 2
MKRIQILGTGCAKCRTLAEAAEAAARRLGQPYELTKVTDLAEISAMGVMMTPALVVDGRVKVSGRVPGADELARLLA